ncbi:MAG: hypothetical protein M1608_11425 [Candidatus Omnitrophica bacterium]|nr:hypothetical protein [Candidatus Omnitrophota bacterium]
MNQPSNSPYGARRKSGGEGGALGSMGAWSVEREERKYGAHRQGGSDGGVSGGLGGVKRGSVKSVVRGSVQCGNAPAERTGANIGD